MKKTLMVILGLALSGCATTGVFTTTGFGLVTSFTEPVTVTEMTDLSKEGRSCSRNWFAIASFGDGSILAAKRDGGITKVGTVDREVVNILGIYGHACTIVRGN